MAPWPDLTEYHEAVQNPQRSFADSRLKKVELELDRFGMPKPVAGGNAVVYKATEPFHLFYGIRKWAIRCFLRPITDHAERYDAISKHLTSVHLPYSTKFVFQKKGILVQNEWLPIVKMAWVEGELFHMYLEKCLKKPNEMVRLRGAWARLVRELEVANVAHGDLQHGNIIVNKGRLLLVDYDGMWVPTLKGRKATEGGHRAYQHPNRAEDDYGLHLDRFSALVIFLSIAALEKKPSLWDDYNNGDNLIFVRDDFVSPGKTEIWDSLKKIESPGINFLVDTILQAIQNKPMDSPQLELITNRLYQSNSTTTSETTTVPAKGTAPIKKVSKVPPTAPSKTTTVPTKGTTPIKKVSKVPPTAPSKTTTVPTKGTTSIKKVSKVPSWMN